MKIQGKIVDVLKRRIFSGSILVENGRIKEIREEKDVPDRFIMPGFVDAHVHIESSMLTPVRFAELAIRQGTVGVVTDPHEIGNVLGVEGIEYMVEEAGKTPLKIKFGIPSCVPATKFETSGAVIEAKDIERLFEKDAGYHLAEMMNYPGVIYEDRDVMDKLEVAKRYGRIVDGHAPGLKGEELEKYVRAGIKTDHECADLREAEEKIGKGMKILIREGSAAKNIDTLLPLMKKYPEEVMFCTDDSHPDDLAERHIRNMAERAISEGYGLWDVLGAAVVNPVKFYGMDVGLLQEGDAADFIVVKDLSKFSLEKVYLQGREVFDGKRLVAGNPGDEEPNVFYAGELQRKKIVVRSDEDAMMKVILAREGSLLTKKKVVKAKIVNGEIISDTDRDVLKMVVVNRYQQDRQPAIGFVQGFGLKRGALAGSIAHDSHNVIAVGVKDEEIIGAINAVIRNQGGIAVHVSGETEVLPLPVAGLMSNEKGEEIAEKYKGINKKAKETGTTLNAPFMTLSFMALLVIPEIKLSDRGLFDGRKFKFTKLMVKKI